MCFVDCISVSEERELIFNKPKENPLLHVLSLMNFRNLSLLSSSPQIRGIGRSLLPSEFQGLPLISRWSTVLGKIERRISPAFFFRGDLFLTKGKEAGGRNAQDRPLNFP